MKAALAAASLSSSHAPSIHGDLSFSSANGPLLFGEM